MKRRLGRVRRALEPEPDAFADIRDPSGPILVHAADVMPDPDRGDTLGLVILLPFLELHRMTGGPNTALHLGARVAARGVPVRVVATHGPLDADVAGLLAHTTGLAGLRTTAVNMTFESVAHPLKPLQLGPRDVVMATWWQTAYPALDALAVTTSREFLYLVQDFEPAFYASSSNYALALATYDMPVRAIFNEALLREHFIVNRIGRLASGDAGDLSIAFDPAVDRSLFRALPKSGPRRLVFYARPKNPRNAFELGLRALRVAVQRGVFEGPWEFCSIGAEVPELDLGGGRTLRAVPWQALPEYAAFLGSSDVLLSLMLSPHTSYPPLEMVAAGGTVVTNTFGVKTVSALAALSDRILAAKPEVEPLVKALAAAAARPSTPAAAAPLNVPTSWDQSLEPVVDWIMASMADIAGA